jgi:hypothetical protein
VLLFRRESFVDRALRGLDPGQTTWRTARFGVTDEIADQPFPGAIGYLALGCTACPDIPFVAGPRFCERTTVANMNMLNFVGEISNDLAVCARSSRQRLRRPASVFRSRPPSGAVWPGRNGDQLARRTSSQASRCDANVKGPFKTCARAGWCRRLGVRP